MRDEEMRNWKWEYEEEAMYQALQGKEEEKSSQLQDQEKVKTHETEKEWIQ